MSACNASRLRAVSLSVSPFVRLEVVAEILITSALRRNAASSKEVRVRVLGSTKKLTSVLPRNAGTFFISRVPTCLNASVVSRTKLISYAYTLSSPSKSLRALRVVIGSGERTRLACWRARPRDRELLFDLHQHARCVHYPESWHSYSFPFQPDGVGFVVGFLQADLNLFAGCSRQIFSDVIGTNRQLAMAAIYQHGELDSRGASKRVDCIHRRTHGATCVKNVIDNNHRPALQRYWKFRRSHYRQFLACAHVVAMHSYINDAGLNVSFFDLPNESRDSARDLHAARWNPRDHHASEARISLDDLMRNPAQRAMNCFRVHDWDAGG